MKRKFERSKVLIVNGKKIGGWIVRGGIAAVGCSSMGADSIGGKNYCSNLLWQSSVTLFPQLVPPQLVCVIVKCRHLSLSKKKSA